MLYYTYEFNKLVLILIVGWLIFRLTRAFLHGKPNLIRAFLIWGLFFFVLFLLYQTLEPFVFIPDQHALKANLRPLKGIMDMIENASKFDDRITRLIDFINIVGNILIFSPYGIF